MIDDFPDLPPEIEEQAKRPPADRDWPREWMSTFLRSLQVLPEEQSAADVAGISMRTVKLWRERLLEFEEAIADAHAFQRAHYQRLMHQWATTGLLVEDVREEITEHMNGTRTVKRYTSRSHKRSERIAIKLLESWIPEVYARPSRVEHTGEEGGPIEVRSLSQIDAEIERLSRELGQPLAND